MIPEFVPPLILVVVAGPNGAGKSTFVERHLASSGMPFVNADLIAKEQFDSDAGEHAMEAARVADQVRLLLVRKRRSFIFETVLSDPVGDKVAFFEFRVARGGHDVPDDKLLSRYPRTLQNLIRLLDVADRLSIYDNSEVDRAHRLVARLERGRLVAMVDPVPTWLTRVNLSIRRTASTQTI